MHGAADKLQHTSNMAVDTTRRHGPGGMDGGTVIDSDWYRLCCSDDTRPGYRYPGPAKDMTPSISWGSRTRKIRGLDAGDLDLVGDQAPSRRWELHPSCGVREPEPT